MLTVTRIFSFGAAHQLPNHLGKCNNLHGHEWKVYVEVANINGLFSEGPSTGMLIDFKELDTMISDRIINRYFDHHCINDIIKNPTAENITLFLVDKINEIFTDSLVILVSLKVYETENSFVTWTR